MKTRNDFQVNPAKLIPAEELMQLKGGNQPQECFECRVVHGGEILFYDIWCGQDLYTAQGECTVFYSLPCFCELI
jgi:hypothetical protein